MYNLGFVTTNLNLFRREGQILDRAGHGGEQTLIWAHATYLKEASVFLRVFMQRVESRKKSQISPKRINSVNQSNFWSELAYL